MSMSSNGLGSQEFPVPVKSFSYRDMGAPAPFPVKETRQGGAEQEREPPAAPRGVAAGDEGSAEPRPHRGSGRDRGASQDGI